MSQTYYAILTAVGEAKLANATALGTQLQISRMAVGDGNGALPTPTRLQTELVGEQYRADLNSLTPDPLNANQIIAEMVIPETEGGWWIREMGLYDATGALIAVSNCPPSYKPQMSEGSGRTQILRMVLIVSSTTAVQLKIDPSVVLATKQDVITIVQAEISKLDTKPSVLVATTGPITLNGLQTVDGIALNAGARVLVKNQALAQHNGIYNAAAGGWLRAQDADISVEVTPGLLVHVETGTINADSLWHLVTDAPIVLGTTPLLFEQVAGATGISAGTYRSVTVDRYGRVIAGTNPPIEPALAALSRVIAIDASTGLTPSQMGLVLADASAANLVATLPLADVSLGIVDVIIRRTDATANSLNITASGTDKIMFDTATLPDGVASWPLAFSGDWLHLRADAAGRWWVVGQSALPASEDRQGLVQFADIATALEGLSTQLAIHPAALKAFIGILPFSKEYESPELTYTAGGPIGPISHNLGGQHRLAVVEMINQETDAGFAPGESYFMLNGFSFQASEGMAIKSDATHWNGRWGSSRIGSGLSITSGAVINLTGTRWRAKVRLYK